jgi:threonine dehydrogenase-like Zn-dependent dehydrogenase
VQNYYIISDLDEGRLAKAKELGADYTIKVDSRDGKEVAKKIMEQLGPADRTIECTGAESSIHTGIYVSCFELYVILLDNSIITLREKTLILVTNNRPLTNLLPCMTIQTNSSK